MLAINAIARQMGPALPAPATELAASAPSGEMLTTYVEPAYRVVKSAPNRLVQQRSRSGLAYSLQVPWIATIVVFLAPSMPAVGAAEGGLRERVEREAPAAWRRYREFVPHFQGTAVFRLIVDGNETQRTSHTFKQRPEARLWVLERWASSNGRPSSAIGTVLGLNERYSFKLRRSTEQDDWYISGISPRAEDEGPMGNSLTGVAREIGDLRQLTCVLLRLCQGNSLDELFAQPTFRLVDAANTGDEGVRIVFDCQHPRDAKPFVAIQSGALVLDPNQSWCLRSAELNCEYSTGPSKARLTTTYTDGPKGFAVPIRWTEKAEGVDEEEGAAITHSTIDFVFDVDVPAQPPNAEEFTLSAFGLPEPGNPRRPLLRLFVYALVGLLLVVAGVAIRRRLAAQPRP